MQDLSVLFRTTACVSTILKLKRLIKEEKSLPLDCCIFLKDKREQYRGMDRSPVLSQDLGNVWAQGTCNSWSKRCVAIAHWCGCFWLDSGGSWSSPVMWSFTSTVCYCNCMFVTNVNASVVPHLWKYAIGFEPLYQKWRLCQGAHACPHGAQQHTSLESLCWGSSQMRGWLTYKGTSPGT